MGAAAPVLVDAPGVPAAAFAGCHAVRVGRLVWISAVCGLPSESARSSGDMLAEMARAIDRLRAVLAAAGLEVRDLARVNVYYAPSRVSNADLTACRRALRAALDAGNCAGVTAMLAPAAEGARLTLDAVAADRGSKQVLLADRDDSAGSWATATRAGSTIFVSAVAPERALLESTTSAAPRAPGGSSSLFFDRSYSAYRQLAHAIERARERWPDCRGLADVVRVHQHVTRPAIDLAEFRRSREDLLRTGEFVSTTVLAGGNDPDRAGLDPWIKIDAELAVGARRRVAVSGVWANPGGLHALSTNDLTFLQAQMGRDVTGTSVHADDPERHAARLYENIDGMLAGAGLAWRHVVHARVFCRDRQQFAPAARLLESRLAGHPCATTCLVAGFFDPRALLEVEVTAAAGEPRLI